MADQSTHINYTYSDIQRYLQGKMPAAEMHAIEKAALQDPFLADAIEGYSEPSATTAGQHLNEINAALSGGQQKPGLVLSFGKRQWWRVAAVVILLAGTGIAGLYLLNTSNPNHQVAQQKNEPSANKAQPLTDTQENKLQPQTFAADSNSQSEKTEQYKKVKEPERRNTASEDADDLKSEDNANRSVIAAASAEGHADSVANISPMAFTIQPDSLNTRLKTRPGASINQVTISGQVIDENGQPVPNVIVQTGKAAALTNTNGDFSFMKQDSTVNVSANAVGYEMAQVELKAGQTNRILLKQDYGALNEVVVTAYGSKKDSASQDKNAAPVGGWDNFNRYVQERLNKDTSDYYIDNSDLVELEFSVDKAGNPVDIQFLRSLDPERNAQALDIIKQGPKWTARKNKKVRIQISF